MERKVGGAGSEITSCFFPNISVAGSGAFWTSFSRVSHNQTSSLLARPLLWVTPPLIRSDWPRGAEETRERLRKKRERQGYSLSTLTHSNEPGREKNASTQLTALFRISSAFSAARTELPPSFTILELLISITDWTTRLWPRGRRCFLFGGECFDRSWPRRSAAIRSRSPCFIPSVRCLQWRPNMPPCCSRSAKWRVFQTAWMSWVMKSCPARGHPPSSFQHTPLLSWWVAKPFLGLTQTHARDTHVHVAQLSCVCIVLVYSPHLPTPMASSESRGSCFRSLSLLVVC